MAFIDALFDSLIKSNIVRKIEKTPLLIYGAGAAGRSIDEQLTFMGYEVLAYVDKNFDLKCVCKNKRVLSLQQAARDFGLDIQILIAIHNRGVDMVEVIKSLELAGFSNVFTMFDYIRQFPEDNTFRYFLTDPKNLISEKSNAQKFYNLLEDDTSKDLYLNLIKFRLSGDYRICPIPLRHTQYSPPDIPRWKSPLRFIDCGAYDGDSINLLSSSGYDFESIIALEPDLNNYQQLIENINFPNSVFLPCGVASYAKSVQFNTGDGESSRASQDGSITIQMLSIDEAFPFSRPNLIKMDIEGGEREALLGAKDTIKKSQPGIALSAYHLPFDLWGLGLLIYEIYPSYRFYIRTHGFSSFETVLYAVPR
jgi:FkbM family methyltransferase